MRLIEISIAVLIGAAAPVIAWSQSGTPSITLDRTQLVTRDEMRDMSIAIQSLIPKPAQDVPPSEMIGGAVGSAGTYRPADARQPRITRSRTLTLAADGTATFDWSSQGALTGPVQLAITPVFSGIGVPKCWATAVTTTSATVRCVLEASSLINVLGVQVAQITNAAPAGLTVGVIALPSS